MKRIAIASAVVAVGSVLLAGTPAGAATSAPHITKVGAHLASPAVEGTFPIYLKGCTTVSEQIELRGSPKHDYIRWVTDGNAIGCTAEIIRNGSTIESEFIITPGVISSGWYYDGPGNTARVCVSDANGDACGPLN